MEIPVQNIADFPQAATAQIQEVRIAFTLRDDEGSPIGTGGAYICDVSSADLPITQECIQQAIYEALPQAEEES